MVSITDADILISIIAGSLLFFLLCVFIVAFSALYARRKQQYKVESQKLRSEFAETLLRSQLEIKEQTLQNISYELHDNLGQIASIIKINLNTLRLEDIEKAEQKIEDTKELVRQLITDLKVLSVSLSSDRVAQLGILRCLEGEAERLNRIGQFETTLQHDGNVPALDVNTSTILFRMTQEILNNIVKHSGAKHITISLLASGNLLTLVCADDGVGFNKEEKIKSGGSGLINLHSRAKLIHARLTLLSAPQQGTKISIELPL
jgi:signal transduction histidine kinase